MKLIRLFYRRMTLVMIAVFALLIIAAQGDIPEFSTLEQFLVWVGTGGGSMILAGFAEPFSRMKTENRSNDWISKTLI